MVRSKSKIRRKRKTYKKRATMGKDSINPFKYPNKVDIETIKETYFEVVSHLAELEKKVELKILRKLETEKIKTLVLRAKETFKNCGKVKDDVKFRECMDFFVKQKEMISILKLNKDEVEEALNDRVELRKERLFRLIQLTYNKGIFLKEKIKTIILNTGGLSIIDLDLQSSEYKNIISQEIIHMYNEVKNDTYKELRLVIEKNRQPYKKRATMGKHTIERKHPVDININTIRKQYSNIVENIAEFEYSVDVDLLNQIKSIPSVDTKVIQLMVECANNKDDKKAECINKIRPIKEMVRILNPKIIENELEQSQRIENELEQRLEFRQERLYKLKYLSEISNFYRNEILLEKIEEIVKETGGLVVELNFNLRGNDGLTKAYKDLLGKIIISLYRKYKVNVNMKSRDEIIRLTELHRQKANELKNKFL